MTGAPPCLFQPQGREGAFIRHRCIPNCFTLVTGPCEEAHLGPGAGLGSVRARDAAIAVATTALVGHHQHHRQCHYRHPRRVRLIRGCRPASLPERTLSHPPAEKGLTWRVWAKYPGWTLSSRPESRSGRRAQAGGAAGAGWGLAGGRLVTELCIQKCWGLSLFQGSQLGSGQI